MYRGPGGLQSMQPRSEGVGFSTQHTVESDLHAATWLAIKDGTTRHCDAEHLLQTERLSAELNLIAPVRFEASVLVLDRKRLRTICRFLTKLNDIHYA